MCGRVKMPAGSFFIHCVKLWEWSQSSNGDPRRLKTEEYGTSTKKSCTRWVELPRGRPCVLPSAKLEDWVHQDPWSSHHALCALDTRCGAPDLMFALPGFNIALIWSFLLILLVFPIRIGICTLSYPHLLKVCNFLFDFIEAQSFKGDL
jgi:hypothetical protein